MLCAWGPLCRFPARNIRWARRRAGAKAGAASGVGWRSGSPNARATENWFPSRRVLVDLPYPLEPLSFLPGELSDHFRTAERNKAPAELLHPGVVHVREAAIFSHWRTSLQNRKTRPRRRLVDHLYGQTMWMYSYTASPPAQLGCNVAIRQCLRYRGPIRRISQWRTPPVPAPLRMNPQAGLRPRLFIKGGQRLTHRPWASRHFYRNSSLVTMIV